MPETDLESILRDTETIAVVGCSRDSSKDANRVPSYMIEHGYEVIPVNPHADEILGRKVYPDLESARSGVDTEIDMVDVFRPTEETPPIARSSVEINAEVLWLQLGIRSEKTKKIAEDAGLNFVQDRCFKIEHQRMMRE